MFTLNTSLIQQKTQVIQRHEDRLINQLEMIIKREIVNKTIKEQDSLLLARTLFGLMSSFYHPAFSEQWRDENITINLASHGKSYPAGSFIFDYL